MGGKALYLLYHFGSGVGREDTNEQVNVIVHDGKGEDLPSFFFAFGAYPAFAFCRKLTYQHGLSAFRAEDQVVDKQVNAMLVSLVFHIDIYTTRMRLHQHFLC